MLTNVYNKLIKYNEIISKYKKLPIKTSIWMEYEVTSSIARWYESEIWSNFKKDITTISEYSWVWRWNDAIHEIATKPTDNPYLTILEIQLLQDLDFLDLNFKKQDYEKWARWIHLTLWWEYWIYANNSTNFIQNCLQASNFWWVNAWKEVDNINRISNLREKWYDCEAIFWHKKTECCEYRTFNIDKSESFERLVISIFNLNMAKQAIDKYVKKSFILNWLFRKYKNIDDFKENLKSHLIEG